jgi:hypothetical protein
MSKPTLIMTVCFHIFIKFISSFFCQSNANAQTKTYKASAPQFYCLLHVELYPHTQKNFGTRRSIFVCCTEDIYKFVCRSYLSECSPCGTRPDSSVTWKSLFVSAPIALFWGGGGWIQILNMENFNFFLSDSETIKIKLKRKVSKVWWVIRRK